LFFFLFQLYHNLTGNSRGIFAKNTADKIVHYFRILPAVSVHFAKFRIFLKRIAVGTILKN